MTLTKKGQPFNWTKECHKALDTPINIVLPNLILCQLDLSKPFFLQVNALAYTTGAILTQRDKRGKHIAVGFHSHTFNYAKQNYNIHYCKLLAVFRGLTNYQHLLLSSPHPVIVYTDHKNLEYYHKPQNINRRRIT